MEEKERYECKYNEKLMKHYTFDNENKEELGYKGVVRVLNQQDKRIKELEAISVINKDFVTKVHKEVMQEQIKEICKAIVEENQQLKQQLEQLEKGKELDNSFWKQECDSLQKQLAEKEKEISKL